MANLPPTTTSPFSVLDRLEAQGNLPIEASLQTQMALDNLPPPVPLPPTCQAKHDNKIEINQEDTLVVNTKRIQ
jgi:hypothetical protein